MTEANPWKKVSSALIYENQWMQIQEDTVIRPDGNSGIYAYLKKTPAVGIVALTEHNELYLVGQHRYPTDIYSWELIEGGANDGEALLEAAKRELQEEAGLAAASWEQIPGEIQLSNCVTAEIGHLFIARELSDVGANPEPTEILQTKTVPFAEAVQMVESGVITDSLSMIGILRVARILGV